MKPTMEMVKVHQSQMLCTSIKSLSSSGLSDNDDDDLEYDNSGGDQGLAW